MTAALRPCPWIDCKQALEKLQREWDGAELGVLPHRETGTYVLKFDDALSQQLDDHLVLLSSMAFSPHKKFFEERLAKWQATLTLVRHMHITWAHAYICRNMATKDVRLCLVSDMSKHPVTG